LIFWAPLWPKSWQNQMTRCLIFFPILDAKKKEIKAQSSGQARAWALANGQARAGLAWLGRPNNICPFLLFFKLMLLFICFFFQFCLFIIRLIHILFFILLQEPLLIDNYFLVMHLIFLRGFFYSSIIFFIFYIDELYFLK
jgi:hypothetical protein